VKARRHVESLSALTAEEAGTLGPVLRAAVAAVERVVGRSGSTSRRTGSGYGTSTFFLLPRTSSLPAGHVLSDVYRRARSQLRKWKIMANPTTAARAEAAERIRSDEAWKTLST